MFQSSATSFEARVAQGVAFLNDVKPGWYRGIDLAKLDISCPDNCACAQVEGCKYGMAVSRLYKLKQFEESNLGFIQDIGLGAGDIEIRRHYAQLTTAWRKAIIALCAGTYVGVFDLKLALAA